MSINQILTKVNTWPTYKTLLFSGLEVDRDCIGGTEHD